MFDVTSYLDARDIEYQSSGKNVSKGWINISCVFCDEKSNHLGISNSGGFHCWVCGEKGKTPHSLVMKIDNCSYKRACETIEKFDLDFVHEDEDFKSTVSEVEFPKGMEKIFSEPHRQYLISRGFNPDELINQYGLKSCFRLGGGFAYRIIIPIYIGGRLVSYTSRDITDKQKEKYKHLSNNKSIIQIKDCLYNIDTVKDKGIIVEGVADVWRIGAGSIALFGTEYTGKQLQFLFKKRIKEMFVMFDSDATKKAYKLGNILSTFIPKVEILELSNGDPAELNIEEVIKLKQEINF